MGEKMQIKTKVMHVLCMLFFLAAASLTGLLFQHWGIPEANIVIVYLLAVVLTVWLTNGFLLGIIASTIATFAFNYFFTEPVYTFSVNDPSYIITLVIMSITALITSTLTSRAKISARHAKEKEAEIRALYELTNRLTDAETIDNVVHVAAEVMGEVMGCHVTVRRFGQDSMPEGALTKTQRGKDSKCGENEQDAAYWAANSGQCAEDDTYIEYPIAVRGSVLGVVLLPRDRQAVLNDAQAKMLQSMVESTALAMDRLYSAQEKIKSREEAMQERYRGNLLRAISHDLRTPLASIMGTAEMMMDMLPQDGAAHTHAKNIYGSAEWLHDLVENILALTRLQDGKLAIKKQEEAAEEVIGSAIQHMAQRAPGREMTVAVPDELLLVPMDAKLIQQVLINLLDNAVKYTTNQQEIMVSVSIEPKENMAVFVVTDKGVGIAPEDLPHIFEMFYTRKAPSADAVRGIGLGLPICDAIIRAHGGSMSAENRPDGPGAVFTFTLPLEAANDKLP